MSSYSVEVESEELIEDVTDTQGPYHWKGTDEERRSPPLWNSRILQLRIWTIDKIDKLKGISRFRPPPLHWLLGGIGAAFVLILIIMSVAGAFSHPQPDNNGDLPISRNQKLVSDHGTVVGRNNNAELQGTMVRHRELQSQNKQVQNNIDGLKNLDKWETFKTHFTNQSWGSELLFTAISQEDEKTVQVLVQVGADLNGRNNNSETPLIRAALSGDKDASVRIMKYLMEHGADVLAEDLKDQTFLHNLVADGTSLTPSQFNDMTEYLILKNYSSLFDKPAGIKEVTPLMLALKNVDVENATLTILHNNGVNFTSLDMEGDGLLKYALEGKRGIGMLSQLINLGANWKNVNSYKFTLLHFSAYFGMLEALKYFVNLGLDVNAKDGHGTTPLHIVAFHMKENVFEAVRFLKEHGADITIMNQSKKTPVHDAMRNQKLDRDQKKRLVELLNERI